MQLFFAEVAIAPNSQEIHVYEYDKSIRDWIILDKLNKHDLRITGIDWAPKTNRIVTCSEVRMYVLICMQFFLFVFGLLCFYC